MVAGEGDISITSSPYYILEIVYEYQSLLFVILTDQVLIY